MAKVLIELDLEVVQEAINARSMPAVMEVLSRHYDLTAMIETALAKATSGQWDRWNGHIEGLIKEALFKAARDYVKSAIDENRDAIRSAFQKMMQDSPDKLANAFAKAIEGAELHLFLSAEVSTRDPDDGY